MMKRYLTLILCLVLVLSLAACGEDQKNTNPTQGGNNEQIVETVKPQQTEPSQTQPTEPAVDYSQYLRFKLNKDGQSYYCYASATGYSGPGTELVIPSHYEGLPVTEVKDLHLSDSDVQRVVLPDTVIVLGDYAFSDSKVSEVVFSKNLIEIGDCAFSGCSQLTDIQFPESLQKIGASAFRRTGLKKLVLPASVAEMGMDCFAELEFLEEATITCAGGRAFKDCKALKKVTFIQGAGDTIGSKAFYGCTALETVEFLGDNILEIYSEAFYRCENVKSMVLPAKLQFIGNECFDACYSMETLEIPDSVTRIEHEALMTDKFGDPCGTVICSEGSYAESYAKSHKYTIVYK